MAERKREHRKARRTKRRNAAWIALSSDGVRIPCVLWDMSDGGARIAAARASALPPVFCLLMSSDGATRRFCKVVWRKEGQVGVRFIDEDASGLDFDGGSRRYRRAQPAAPAAPPAARVSDAGATLVVLPGAGPSSAPRAGVSAEPRAVSFSSVAFAMAFVLAAAAGLFTFADMQSAVDAPWALRVCGGAKNFCAHPEWTAVASAVMTVVWLAARGMEL
jgi:PilZ domain